MVREKLPVCRLQSGRTAYIYPGQPFSLEFLYQILKAGGDPAFALMRDLKEGVTAGVLHELPRTPEVYEEQKKWRLSQDPLAQPFMEASNYKSMKGYENDVEEQSREDEKNGLMMELSDEDMAKRFGNNIAVSALAVLVERTS